MSKYSVDFTAINKAVQDQVDAAEAQAAQPASGISADQEAADIAAATAAVNAQLATVQAQVQALQADDDAKAATIQSLQDLEAKIKALLS